jgi:hypothetical protein
LKFHIYIEDLNPIEALKNKELKEKLPSIRGSNAGKMSKNLFLTNCLTTFKLGRGGDLDIHQKSPNR